MTAAPPPPSLPSWLTGSVDSIQLRALLEVQAESTWLDYKSECDLSRTRDTVELAKDIGAMSMLGGYLVVGADDRGAPAGTPSRLDLFDQARLFDKVKKYLPEAELHVGRHQLGNQDYAVVYIAPHADGFAVFAGDGQYPDPRQQGKTVEVYRRGDVYARHGTASERWTQADVTRIRRQLSASATRRQDREQRCVELGQQLARTGPGRWCGPVRRPAIAASQRGQARRCR